MRAGERWRIAREHGGRGVPPWEVGEFAERRTRHFVVLAPPEAAVDDLVAALEAGYADDARACSHAAGCAAATSSWSPADAAQARALTTEIRGVETLAALSDASVNESGPERRTVGVVSLRLLVVLAGVHRARPGRPPARRSRTSSRTPALTGATSGRTPAWLVEGVALYVSGDRRPAPPGADLAALSAPDAIARLTGDGAGRRPTRPARPPRSRSPTASARAGCWRSTTRSTTRSCAGEPGPRLVRRAVRRELGMSLVEVQAGM